MGLTLLCVHAHPDDEASFTGGVLRRYADEGIRTVLVTCTNGEFGDAPGGVHPSDAAHDPEAVAALRAEELDQAARHLRVDRLVRLGYRDSGMMGWAQNDDPRCFWRTDVATAADRLARVVAEERPQVVVTYNENGFYGHPDHIQANRITLAALATLDDPPTLYYNAIPESVMVAYRARWLEEDRAAAEAKGEEFRPEPAEYDLGTPDDLVDAAIDVAAVAGAKFDALAAHASQLADSFWMTMGRDRFVATMTTEWFVRATNPRGLEGRVSDLFAGYR